MSHCHGYVFRRLLQQWHFLHLHTLSPTACLSNHCVVMSSVCPITHPSCCCSNCGVVAVTATHCHILAAQGENLELLFWRKKAERAQQVMTTIESLESRVATMEAMLGCTSMLGAGREAGSTMQLVPEREQARCSAKLSSLIIPRTRSCQQACYANHLTSNQCCQGESTCLGPDVKVHWKSELPADQQWSSHHMERTIPACAEDWLAPSQRTVVVDVGLVDRCCVGMWQSAWATKGIWRAWPYSTLYAPGSRRSVRQ
jgi:hypothetical protein